MSITFVSAFFDIGRKTEVPLQKYENYFTWINKLLDIPITLYFFTTLEIHDRLTYQPRNNLIFGIIDKYPGSEKLSQIQNIWSNYVTNNPEKDTAEFACLTHSKFHLLNQAINVNPFNSTHYAWIDAGILKIATHGERLPTLYPPDKIKLLIMNFINSNEVKDPAFVRTCRYKIAGGLFIGPKDNIKTFCDKMITTVNEDINNGNFGLEQEYMAIVYRQDTSIFDPYYGDFSDLILNYDKCERNEWLPIRVFHDGDEEQKIKVDKYLLKSGIVL